MKVEYRKRFLTDLARIPSGPRKTIEAFVFNEAPKMESVGVSGKIERMKGYKSSYKVTVRVLSNRIDGRRRNASL